MSYAETKKNQQQVPYVKVVANYIFIQYLFIYLFIIIILYKSLLPVMFSLQPCTNLNKAKYFRFPHQKNGLLGVDCKAIYSWCQYLEMSNSQFILLMGSYT